MTLSFYLLPVYVSRDGDEKLHMEQEDGRAMKIIVNEKELRFISYIRLL
ncbi:hypothetical protein JOC55_004739 [Paenibacillus sacheonensis]|nr:hypothetical protein [Paenibacillus sacheonensis]